MMTLPLASVHNAATVMIWLPPKFTSRRKVKKVFLTLGEVGHSNQKLESPLERKKIEKTKMAKFFFFKFWRQEWLYWNFEFKMGLNWIKRKKMTFWERNWKWNVTLSVLSISPKYDTGDNYRRCVKQTNKLFDSTIVIKKAWVA